MATSTGDVRRILNEKTFRLPRKKPKNLTNFLSKLMLDGWNKTSFPFETVPLPGDTFVHFRGRCVQKTFLEKMRCPWWNPCMFEPTQKAVTFFKPAAWIKHIINTILILLKFRKFIKLVCLPVPGRHLFL